MSISHARLNCARLSTAHAASVSGSSHSNPRISDLSPSADVFSLGLILCRMFTGSLPEWPYRWPPQGLARRRRRLHPDLVEFMRKATEVDSRRRYTDARQMLVAFRRLKPRSLRFAARVDAKKSNGTARKSGGTSRRKAAS